MAQPNSNTDTLPEPSTDTPSCLIDIAILDLGPFYEEGVRHYLQQDPARAQWPEEKRRRLRIRTECRWARAQPSPEEIYLLNERGEGPLEPLSDTVCAYLSLYAELEPDGRGDPGYAEKEPFCKVEVNRHTAAALRAAGWVALEKFLDAKIPEMAAAYEVWRELLTSAWQRAKTKKARKVRSKAR